MLVCAIGSAPPVLHEPLRARAAEGPSIPIAEHTVCKARWSPAVPRIRATGVGFAIPINVRETAAQGPRRAPVILDPFRVWIGTVKTVPLVASRAVFALVSVGVFAQIAGVMDPPRYP